MIGALYSINRPHTDNIKSGLKLWEIRKSKPNLPVPFPAFIYETKRNGGCGKVIGEFICDRIYKTIMFDKQANMYLWGNDFIRKETYLSEKEINEYGKGKPLYGLHISNLKIYDKPKEIVEFRKPCIDKYEYCQGCIHGLVTIPPDEEEYAFYHGGNYEFFDTHCMNYLTRPPQLWCYVEI